MLGGAIYRIPAYRYDGYTVYTNTPFGGAFRGFGSPQFTFAAECHTDMIAERLGMDPVEFRLKNLSRPGDKAISGPTLTSCGIVDCLAKAAEAIGCKDKHGNGEPGHRVGVAGEALDAAPEELELRDRKVVVTADPERSLALGDVVQSSIFRDRDGRQIMAQAHFDAPCDLPDPETGVGDFAMSYSFGAHAVEVEVDEETGRVRVVDFVAATDCGNVINPALAESQVEGGAAQGIGYGLLEDLVCEDGQVLNP